jgi:glyceraldehyde-3-phosphate dehydrogenase (ferredoxin)
MKRKKEVDQNKSEKFDYWLNLFEKDKYKAAEEYWYEVHKGIHLTLREF